MTGVSRRAFRLPARLLVVIVTILIATSAILTGGAGASSHLATASEHDTESDFQNAATLTNLTIEGSGSSATVKFEAADNDTATTNVQDDATVTDGGSYGVQINVTDPVHGVSVNISTRSSGDPDAVYLMYNNRTVIETADGTGNTASFTANLEPGKYRIEAENSGGQYTHSRDTSNGQPYTSTRVDIISGSSSVGTTDDIWNIRNVTYGWGAEGDGEYVSGTHDASNLEQGVVDIKTLQDAEVTARWQANDGTGWSTVATSTTTSSGALTTDLSGRSETQWRVNVTVSPTGSEPLFELERDAVLFNSSTPDIDEASATPDDTKVEGSTADLEINVSDADFATTQSDQLTVYWYHNDTLDATTTLSSNATATHTLTNLNVGTNTWHVAVEDTYGNTVATANESYSFTAPQNMTIYNESAPETVIDDREVTLEFYDLNGDEIFTTTTTNGEVELDQLTDSEFAVRISTSDYADRQVIIKDIFKQQNVWLLNESNANIQTVNPTFTVEDETGNFDPTNSRVFIQRGLNISGSTTYRTIAAEEVGTDGYTETLEADQRYRIIVENQEGDRRVLGKFSATDSQTYTLTVEELVFDLSKDGDAIEWGFNYTEVENGQDKVNFRYHDAEDQTDSLDVLIYERGNRSNELHNQTYSGPIGEVSVTEPVPNNNSEWVVEWEAEHGGNTTSATLPAGPLGTLTLPTSDRLLHTMAVGFILIVGGLASQVNAPAVGITTAGTAGIAYYIGWLPGAVAGGMIVLAFFVPVLYLVQSEGGFG